MNEPFAGSLSSDFSAFTKSQLDAVDSTRALGVLISNVAAHQFRFDQSWLSELADDLIAANNANTSEAVFFRYLGLAIKGSTPEELSYHLNKHDSVWYPVAVEGAAMGLCVLDQVMPTSQNRWQQFLRLLAPRCENSLYLGRGLALGLLKLQCQFNTIEEQSLFRWSVIDGMGFQRAYLQELQHSKSTRVAMPQHNCGDTTHQSIFDHGVGRCLYLNHRQHLDQLVASIQCHDVTRQADLWLGVGLASVYIGGIDESELVFLKEQSGRLVTNLAVGACLACRNRVADGCYMPQIELPAKILCGVTANECFRLAEQMRSHLSASQMNGVQYSDYHVWLKRLREFF